MDSWKLPDEPLPNALLLVAHPDDETIFAGGLLLTYPQWQWQVICVTMQSEMRKHEFQNAIAAFCERGVNIVSHQTLDKRDDGQVLPLRDFQNWRETIDGLGIRPDIVITHNIKGEYGHPHHMALGEIALGLFDNVWEFIFPGKNYPQLEKTNTNRIELTKEVLWVKNTVFNAAYQKQQVLWQYLPDIMEYEFRQGPELFTSN